MPGPLQGVKVFDLTHRGVGPWAIMILASMGANVIKIEHPEGDGIRVNDPKTKDLSIIYLHCNLGKRGILLDLKTPEGQEVAKRLIGDADVFVESMKYGTVERLGLGYEKVSQLNPRIVYGSYPGYGSSGPLRDQGTQDTTSQAFSGAVSITGRRDGEGEFNRYQAFHDLNAGAYHTASILLGLLSRERSGKGIKIESSQVGASVAVQTSRIAEFLTTGEDVPRMGSACTTTVPHRAFLCQDNRWLAVGVITDAQWRGLCKAIKSPDLLQDSRFAANSGRLLHRDELEAKLQAIFSTKPARWWTIQLGKHKVPVSLFYDYETIPNLPQVKANRYIVPIKYPHVGTLPFGNVPFQCSKTPIALRPGPWPGQDTEQVLREGFGQDDVTASKGYFGPQGPMRKGVLDGVTVIDMTQGLCGPYASLVLADAGARVIKVEPPEGDYTRQWGPASIDNESPAFFHLNRNKEGLRLDIGKEQDRHKLIELLKTADVFIEEEPLRLGRLRLSYQHLEKINPRLVHCTITPFGTRGPLRNQPASELVLQAMSDGLNTLGVPGEEPVRIGPDLASLGSAIYVTHGILGALYHQWRTGEGQHVTVSMLGTLLHLKGPTWTTMVNPDEWSGFYCEGYAKPPNHGYKTADQHILLAPVRRPELFGKFLTALGMEEYLDDPLFQGSPRDIMGWQGAGDLPLRAKPIWEKVFEKWKADELVDLLQNYRSSSSVIYNYGQLFSLPQMEALGIVREVAVPNVGKVKVLVPPWKFQGIPSVTPQAYCAFT